MHNTALAREYLPSDYEPDIKAKFKPNIFNTCVFLTSCVQQTSVFFVNYKGRPFMENIFDNTVLMIFLLIFAFGMWVCVCVVLCNPLAPVHQKFCVFAAGPVCNTTSGRPWRSFRKDSRSFRVAFREGSGSPHLVHTRFVCRHMHACHGVSAVHQQVHGAGAARER